MEYGEDNSGYLGGPSAQDVLKETEALRHDIAELRTLLHNTNNFVQAEHLSTHKRFNDLVTRIDALERR